MPGFLQDKLAVPIGRDKRIAGVQLIWAFYILGTAAGNGVLIRSAALRGYYVIVAVMLVKMGAFHHANVTALKNLGSLSNKTFLLRVILLQENTRKLIRPLLAVVPFHIQEPVLAVIVMEHGIVKARGIKEHRV